MGRFVPSSQLLLRRGSKMAGVWLIPKETDKPADRRYKKQVKNENENSVG